MAKPRTLGVVLAAGESRRFGPANKLLQPLHGEPLVRHPVKRLLSSGVVDEVLVVLGWQAVKVAEALRSPGVRLAYNPGYREGMASSVRVAAAVALASGYQAALLVPGDSPYPYSRPQELLEPLRGCYEAARPICRGRPGFPVALTRQALREALHLRGDEGLRMRLAAMRLYLLSTQEPCDLDVDTPRDLGEAERLAPQHQKPSSQPP